MSINVAHVSSGATRVHLPAVHAEKRLETWPVIAVQMIVRDNLLL